MAARFMLRQNGSRMPSFTSNLLLASLAPADLEVLQPHLQPMNFKQGLILHEAGDLLTHVYFPFDAIVSLVVFLSNGESVEAAMVGRDGAVGLASALDGKVTLNRAIIQIGGSGVRCDPDELKKLAFQKPSFLSRLINHEQTVFAQAQQSAACIANHDATARLCRWMLRARDLSGSDILPFTQEFLAEMLGVQRTTVSPVAHTLQAAGLIRYKRGRIEILNVEGLRESACECYSTVNAHYEALMRPIVVPIK